MRTGLLDLLPPGKVVRLQLDNELSLYISLSPEKAYKKGRLEVAEFNLKKPFYRIIVKNRGDSVIDYLLIHGDEIHEEGISIKIKETLRWAEFRQRGLSSIASFYSGMVLIFLSLILAIANLLKTVVTG
ncbi:MAG: hypothetical protein ACK4TF_09635 [Thermodesulfovibrionales bacterium]